MIRKKLLCVLLCIILAITLSACGDDDSKNEAMPEESTAAPTAEPEAPVSEATEMPAPAQEQGDVVVDTPITASRDVDLFKYDTLTEGKFSMLYPTHFSRIPATNTICFEETVTDGTIPARIAFTRKALGGRVHSDTKTKQLKSYFRKILAGYESYDMGTLDKKDSFLGDNEAYSVAYTATRDGKLYKGYVIMAAGERVLYVYHFRCGEVDYDRMRTVMERVRDSISMGK